MTKMEQRELSLESLTATKQEDSDAMVVEGYALEWESLSRPIQTRSGEQFYEYFTRGAFDESLEANHQLVLYGHNVNQVLGRTDTGTAQLRSDDKGLYLTVTLPNTTLGHDTYEYVKRGDIAGMSVGFIPVEDDFTYDSELGMVKRSVSKANLLEVSLVPVPAYESSSVSLRAENEVETINEKLEKAKQHMIEKRKRLELLAQL